MSESISNSGKPLDSNKARENKKPELNEAQLKYRRRQRFLRTGQVLMVVGALVAVSHWLAHLEAFGPGQPPGWLDLVAGYPTAGILLVVGAVMASKKWAGRHIRSCSSGHRMMLGRPAIAACARPRGRRSEAAALYGDG